MATYGVLSNFGGNTRFMKLLSTIILTLITITILRSQPDLTLWITPDGYHHTHTHGSEAQYFCDSSYYLFHQVEPDSLFVTLKNEGDQLLEITDVSTQSYADADFQVSFPNSVALSPGEIHVLKVAYQLPLVYANGINGQLNISSNDSNKPNCSLYFDVGCGPIWNIYGDEDLGVPGSCTAPVVHIEYSNDVVSPNLVYKDSMNFYTYDEFLDTSYPMIHMWNKGVEVFKQFDVHEEFRAGKLPADSSASYNFRATDKEVQIAIDLEVQHNVDVGGNLTVDGLMQVDAMTTPSDRRLKQNVLNLESALRIVSMLRPTTYSLKEPKSSDRQQYGFIAQELDGILPDLVYQDSEGQMSVNYLQIIPWLTAAIQEQQQTIDALQLRLDKLEQRD